MPFSRSQPCHSHQLEPCNYFLSAVHALPSASAPQTAPEPLLAAGKRKIHDEAATESITVDINMHSSGQVVVERTERGIPHKFLLSVKTLSDRMIPMVQSCIILSTLLKTKQNRREEPGPNLVILDEGFALQEVPVRAVLGSPPGFSFWFILPLILKLQILKP